MRFTAKFVFLKNNKVFSNPVGPRFFLYVAQIPEKENVVKTFYVIVVIVHAFFRSYYNLHFINLLLDEKERKNTSTLVVFTIGDPGNSKGAKRNRAHIQ